jgi:hypothetical protein
VEHQLSGWGFDEYKLDDFLTVLLGWAVTWLAACEELTA